MPSYPIDIDDASPLWQWSSGWRADPQKDSLAPNYYAGTFHTTNVTGSTASLQFVGQAVTFYTAKRGNRGRFRAVVDGGVFSTTVSTWTNASDRAFKQPLFTADKLDGNKEHTMVITDVSLAQDHDAFFVDVDYASVTIGNGNMSDQPELITLDDTHPNITYPQEGWRLGTPNPFTPTYNNGTFHVTNMTGALAIVSFEGNAIQLYGAVSGNHGLYSVSLDGEPERLFDGRTYGFIPQTLLYYSTGLSPGPHELSITHKASSPNFYTDLDYVVVHRWKTSDENEGTATQTPQAPSSSSQKPKAGIITGAVIGAALLLFLLCLGLCCFLKRRRRTTQGETQPFLRGMQELSLPPLLSRQPVPSKSFFAGSRTPTPAHSGQSTPVTARLDRRLLSHESPPSPTSSPDRDQGQLDLDAMTSLSSAVTQATPLPPYDNIAGTRLVMAAHPVPGPPRGSGKPRRLPSPLA